jgi:hypothetical protein
MLIYLDSVLYSIFNMPGSRSEQNGSEFILGGEWNYWSTFTGEIGEFRFYNGPLTASQISQIYTSTVANYPNPTMPIQMPIKFVASSWNLTGSWPNLGDFGSTYNATVHGTPVKNQAGNGIVFNENLQFRYPSFGSMRNYTQLIWIKRNGPMRTVMAQVNNGTGNFANIIEAASLRSLRSQFQLNGWWQHGADLQIESERWYLVGFVFNGTHMFNYLDGNLISITNMTGAHVEQNGFTHIIGGNWDWWNMFIGEIGELQIYNGVLSDSQIASIYSSTTSLYPNLPLVRELKIHFMASSYSGSGAWTNSGTLGTTHNAVINAGTPSKSGNNAVVFNGGLVFRFPNFGTMARYTQSIWMRRTTNAIGSIVSQQNRGWGIIAGVLTGNGSTAVYGSFLNTWWYNGGTVNLPNLNTWYNITVTWNGSLINIYLNGTIQAISNFTGTFVEQNGLQYFIGANQDGSATFTGHIGELRIYNDAMSDQEVYELYTSTLANFS